jgi:hypothetical protein
MLTGKLFVGIADFFAIISLLALGALAVCTLAYKASPIPWSIREFFVWPTIGGSILAFIFLAFEKDLEKKDTRLAYSSIISGAAGLTLLILNS